MGTKVNSNYEDLISFVRASGGGRATALRPVSYGDNNLPSASFEVIGTGTWDDIEFIDTVGSQVRPGVTSQTSLTNGTTYALFINITDITGATQVRIDGLDGTDRLIGEGDHRISFTSNGGTPRIRLEDTSTSVNDGFTVQSAITAKEVTFDQPDGTLTLFPHPENVPRVEWDADRNRLGLLVEEARTNLFTESEELSSKGHSMNIDDNVAIAPDRTQTASFCKPTTASTEHYIDDANVTAGTDYAISCFAKQGPGDYLLSFRGSGIGANPPRFNLATGTIDNEGASSAWSNTKIEDVGNGWYRCSSIGNPSSTTPLRFQISRSDGAHSFAGDGTSGLYIWGCQIEQASFPTSYIKTTGSTATRSADVASIPVADFGFNTAVGSVVAEYTPTKVNGDVRGVFEIAASTTSNRAYHSASEGNHWLVRSEGDTPAAIDIGTVSENANKVAAVYKKDDFAVSVNGASVGTDTSGNVPISIIEMNIGALQNGFHLNGHIKSIKYFPRRLTNAQLVDLTS
jgi:hypothetical protein